MKITTIRYRKLVSTDRYGHVAVELEAQLQHGDNYEQSFEALRAEVEKQLHGMGERDRIYALLPELQEQVVRLERQRDGLRDDVNANRKIIRDHSDLERLAKERGIDPVGLNGEIPF